MAVALRERQRDAVLAEELVDAVAQLALDVGALARGAVPTATSPAFALVTAFRTLTVSLSWLTTHTRLPPARENGGFEFDPGRNELVLFGGYAGFFRSDVWAFDGTNWSVRSQAPPQRRRAGR